jgi:ABC-type branched-subunit amino acid transport system ATPase component
MALLEVKDLCIHFGGVKAVQNVSFSIEAGMVYAVIGPNGAGKTTLFNLITGVYTPSSGSILLDGEAIQGKAPHELARRGVARTFQNLQICMNMSALENVMLGAHLQLDRHPLKAALRWPSITRRDAQLRQESAELMRFVGLEAYLDARADSMPYGALKRLEIARALALKPRILFLDEPAAGLNPKETLAVDALVRKVADSGVTVVLVEHDMKMVMNLSDRLLVLDYGKKLAEGTGIEVRRNPDVVAAYLGVHSPEAAALAPAALAPPAPVPASLPADVLLRVSGMESCYGRIKALKGIHLEVRRGETVALVGANGAGKTTFLRTLSGVQPLSAGSIHFCGEDISPLRSDQRTRRGICQSPEGRQVFGPLSIEDNLRLGAYTQARAHVEDDLARVFELFPILQEKRLLPAGTLSGGQQQMLAIGRALMGRPQMLLLDEPSMGLAPLLVQEVFNVVKRLKAQGMTILLVEQNAFAALAIADRGYVLETGRVTLTGTGQALLNNEQVRAAYLGM